MRFVTSVVVVISTCAALIAQRPIRVHVLPVQNANGFVDADSKRRADSRLDLIKNLQGDKAVTIVDSREGADVVLELLSSATAETSTLKTETHAPVLGGTARSTTKAETARTVVVKLTAGTYERDFSGAVPAGAIWRAAARSAGQQIKKWIKENQKQLIAKNAR